MLPTVRADHTGAAQAGENGADLGIEAGHGASEGRVQRTFADRQPEQLQHQAAQPPIADRMHDAQVDRQCHHVEAERRARLQTLRHRCQRDAAAVAALASVALHPRHHRPDRRQIDLVVARGKFPISFLQRRLAVRAAHWPRDHRLVRGLHQRSAAALAPQTAFARSLPPRLLAAIGFLARRGWHAGVVRRLWRQPKTGLQFRHPRRQRLNLRPQRSDQGVLLVMRQAAEVRKLGHPKLESRQPGSRQAAILQPDTPLRTQGNEQVRSRCFGRGWPRTGWPGRRPRSRSAEPKRGN